MPCYYPDEDDEKLKTLSEKVPYLEAVLCAIFSELDRRNIAEEVIAEASRYGLINIMDLYLEHSKTDKARLAKDIHTRYSKDELLIIKELIKNTQ